MHRMAATPIPTSCDHGAANRSGWRTAVSGNGRLGWTIGNGPSKSTTRTIPRSLSAAIPTHPIGGTLRWFYRNGPAGGTLDMCRHIGMSTRITTVPKVTNMAGEAACTT